jgi:hypothetical protein
MKCNVVECTRVCEQGIGFVPLVCGITCARNHAHMQYKIIVAIKNRWKEAEYHCRMGRNVQFMYCQGCSTSLMRGAGDERAWYMTRGEYRRSRCKRFCTFACTCEYIS